jgi:hypothetical protein
MEFGKGKSTRNPKRTVPSSSYTRREVALSRAERRCVVSECVDTVAFSISLTLYDVHVNFAHAMAVPPPDQ